jgi:hypothetical protein
MRIQRKTLFVLAFPFVILFAAAYIQGGMRPTNAAL